MRVFAKKDSALPPAGCQVRDVSTRDENCANAYSLSNHLPSNHTVLLEGFGAGSIFAVMTALAFVHLACSIEVVPADLLLAFLDIDPKSGDFFDLLLPVQ